MAAGAGTVVRQATSSDATASSPSSAQRSAGTPRRTSSRLSSAGKHTIAELSLVAERAGTIVGHVLFTRARAGEVDAVLLAPLAVSPEWQGRGVGSALAREGLARAVALGFGIALVLGHPDYYPRFGFEPAEPRGIMPPYPVEISEAWMVAELRPGALQEATGTVRVADALMHEEMWRE